MLDDEGLEEGLDKELEELGMLEELDGRLEELEGGFEEALERLEDTLEDEGIGGEMLDDGEALDEGLLNEALEGLLGTRLEETGKDDAEEDGAEDDDAESEDIEMLDDDDWRDGRHRDASARLGHARMAERMNDVTFIISNTVDFVSI